MARLRAVLDLGWGRQVMLGLMTGVLLLAVTVAAIQVRREDPITLIVQPATDPNQIRVYVGGAVVQPGIYDLKRGSRVAEAIDAAGGPTDVGDVSVLGMAAVLHDADQVLVPVRRAAVPTPTVVSALAIDAVPTIVGAATDTGAPSPPPAVPEPSSGLININTATVAELETLPEIGPAIAQRIIDYRAANGPFQTLDELDNVKGISPRIVELIRPLATTTS